MTIFCEVKGEEVKFTGTILEDGYQIAERLLEGVTFEVDVVDGEIQDNTIRVSDSDKAFFSQFNEQEFLDQMLEYIKQGDVYGYQSTVMEVDTVEIDGKIYPGEVWRDWQNDGKIVEPKEINMFSLGGILGRHK